MLVDLIVADCKLPPPRHTRYQDDFVHQLDPGNTLPPPPTPLPVVTADMFQAFLDRNGRLTERFLAAHPTANLAPGGVLTVGGAHSSGPDRPPGLPPPPPRHTPSRPHPGAWLGFSRGGCEGGQSVTQTWPAKRLGVLVFRPLSGLR